MSQSPWDAYGRRQNNTGEPRPAAKPDFTFGAEREAMLIQEQLRKYLARTLHEYNEIRAGRTGYARIVAEAMKPAPRPESIEETLRRLSGAQSRGLRGDRSDPSSTV